MNFFDMTLEQQIAELDKEVGAFKENLSNTDVGASAKTTNTEQAFVAGTKQDKGNAQQSNILDSEGQKEAARATAARKEFAAPTVFANLSSQRLFNL